MSEIIVDFFIIGFLGGIITTLGIQQLKEIYYPKHEKPFINRNGIILLCLIAVIDIIVYELLF